MGVELVQIAPTPPRVPRPDWLKVRVPGGENYFELKGIMRGLGLHTVCESARCPNVAECWSHRTATFMILGDLCTRRCGFCAVPKGKPAGELDRDEPARVAEAAERMGLNYIVVTSVDRDDLSDGGAGIFARTILALRERMAGCKVEVLIPETLKDLKGSEPEYEQLEDSDSEDAPKRSSKEIHASVVAHESAMGETMDEIAGVLGDLAAAGVEIVTIGQYLRPSGDQLPVARFYTPEEFLALKREGLKRGLRHVESGPLVRSSYHAHEQASSLGRT